MRERKKTHGNDQPAPAESHDSTRQALEFCWDDVSSLRSLGAAPLNDLISAPGSGPPAAGASPARAARAGNRWNLVLLALLVLTLAVAASATLLGR